MEQVTITKEAVKAALDDETIIGDGHSLMRPNYYKPHFDVVHLERTFESDYSSGKSTIFDSVTGQPVEEMKGIYNLDFLSWLCGKAGLTYKDYGSYNGRGSQARAMVSYIAKWAREDYVPVAEDEGRKV